jgi:hypothetical protein
VGVALGVAVGVTVGCYVDEGIWVGVAVLSDSRFSAVGAQADTSHTSRMNTPGKLPLCFVMCCSWGFHPHVIVPVCLCSRLVADLQTLDGCQHLGTVFRRFNVLKEFGNLPIPIDQEGCAQNAFILPPHHLLRSPNPVQVTDCMTIVS